MERSYQPGCRMTDKKRYEEDYKWFGPEIADKLREAMKNSKTECEAGMKRLEVLREYCIKGNPSRYKSAATDEAKFTL